MSERDYSQFDALVFDCDGTLADTMPAHFVAWTKAVHRHGLTFPEDRFYALGGVPAPRIVQLLAREQGKTLDAVAVADEKEQLFEQHLDAVRCVDPVVAIARAYHGRRPMAVASGGYRHIVKQTLQLLQIDHLFQAVVGQEDVEHHKPAPDSYLLAAKRLEVDPQRCCAFEDTDLGLASARAAGMTAVDIRPLCAAR
jgi:HAD superfamily hydrolase (TIGR01509 family)